MTDPSRRKFLQTSSLFGLASLGASIVRPVPARATETAALQMGWLKSVQYAGSFIAQERGYYADEELEVALLPGGPNAPVDPVVISGQAQLGVSATDYAARATANGADYRILGAKNQRHAFCITSRADNPVRAPKDLEGGVRLGLATINQPVLDAIVRLNELDASRITVVSTQGNPAPLAQGEVDCFLTLFTTGPIDLQLQGIETYSFMLSDFGYDIFSGIYISTGSTLDRQGDLVRRMLRAEIRGWQDFVQDVAYAVDLTVDKYAVDQGLDREQQMLQAQAQLDLLVAPDTTANGLFWMSDDKIAANLRTMEVLGIPAERDLFSRALLEELYQGKARIE